MADVVSGRFSKAASASVFVVESSYFLQGFVSVGIAVGAGAGASRDVRVAAPADVEKVAVVALYLAGCLACRSPCVAYRVVVGDGGEPASPPCYGLFSVGPNVTSGVGFGVYVAVSAVARVANAVVAVALLLRAACRFVAVVARNAASDGRTWRCRYGRCRDGPRRRRADVVARRAARRGGPRPAWAGRAPAVAAAVGQDLRYMYLIHFYVVLLVSLWNILFQREKNVIKTVL